MNNNYSFKYFSDIGGNYHHQSLNSLWLLQSDDKFGGKRKWMQPFKKKN